MPDSIDAICALGDASQTSCPRDIRTTDVSRTPGNPLGSETGIQTFGGMPVFHSLAHFEDAACGLGMVVCGLGL